MLMVSDICSNEEESYNNKTSYHTKHSAAVNWVLEWSVVDAFDKDDVCGSAIHIELCIYVCFVCWKRFLLLPSLLQMHLGLKKTLVLGHFKSLARRTWLRDIMRIYFYRNLKVGAGSRCILSADVAFWLWPEFVCIGNKSRRSSAVLLGTEPS